MILYQAALQSMKKTLLTESRIGNVHTNTSTYETTNESVDSWSAMHSYNVIIRVK